MPARRRQTGLDETAVSGLRDKLAAGGRPPRVGISGSQFPAGTTGAVVRVGDPATDGEDYVTVRVKLGSTTDELTFAPAELTLPGAAPRPAGTSGRAKAARPAGAANPATTGAGNASSDAGSSPTPTALGAATPHGVTPADGPSTAASGLSSTAVTRTTSPARRRAPARAEGSAENTTPAARTARTPGRTDPAGGPPRGVTRPRRSAPQKVTLTVTSDGSDWTVSAQRGARTVLKRVAVLPGTVGAIAELLGDDAVLDAVASVNDSAREHAESRAAQLRAELAELDQVIASHQRPRRR